ncbi:unnamed protein product [Phytophthora fragariaefolia]|uniref:Unnamed protein product n=1 Tax=Phytophthora fragariaefolia TaxID=1490495 RepID=A0A9W6XRY6_9STRA|nr:unnamed protein product [Phytophthora fragariaefolia]
MNRTIMKKARSMLHYKGVSMELWTEVVSTAVYLNYRSTNMERSDVTPYGIGFKVKPRMEHLRVFGSPGYTHIDDGKRTKLDPKSFRCMLLGYAENAKGYGVYDMGVQGQSGTVSEAGRARSGRNKRYALATSRNAGGTAVVTVGTVRRTWTGVGERPTTTSGVPGGRIGIPPEPERSRRSQERLFLLENGDDERKSEASDRPPSPNRPRIDEDGLIAEAVLTYAVNVIDGTDPPATYAQVMASDEAAE